MQCCRGTMDKIDAHVHDRITVKCRQSGARDASRQLDVLYDEDKGN